MKIAYRKYICGIVYSFRVHFSYTVKSVQVICGVNWMPIIFRVDISHSIQYIYLLTFASLWTFAFLNNSSFAACCKNWYPHSRELFFSVYRTTNMDFCTVKRWTVCVCFFCFFFLFTWCTAKIQRNEFIMQSFK